MNTAAPAASATPAPAAPARTAFFTALLSHKWPVLIAVTLAILGGWLTYRFLLGPEVAGDHAKRGVLIETVVATGSVETPFRVDIASQITGTVVAVQVDEGQRVTQGQPLIALESA